MKCSNCGGIHFNFIERLGVIPPKSYNPKKVKWYIILAIIMAFMAFTMVGQKYEIFLYGNLIATFFTIGYIIYIKRHNKKEREKLKPTHIESICLTCGNIEIIQED